MALLMAVVVAGSLTYLLLGRLRRSVARPQLVQVVAAAKDLPAGMALTAGDVKLIEWPAGVPLQHSFSKVEQVVGRPMIYPLSANQPVLERDLAIPGSGVGLSVKIPAGMRATSVRSNEVVGVAGFLFPGSHVDVLGTFNLPGNPSPVTQTILQNVEVLTAGTQIEPDPQGKPQAVNVVTLLLDSEDSQKLLLASTQGTIQFVLRSGADQQKVNATPTRLDHLVALAKPPDPPAPKETRRRAAPAATPKPSEVFVMEVIQGTTRTDEKF
jgi:pilus assembly protein CpaB